MVRDISKEQEMRLRETVGVREEHINLTRGGSMGGDDCDDPYMETTGEVYKFGVKEYGRCTSKVYVDTPTGVHHVGWVFVKREQYTDSDKMWLHETWISLYERVDGQRIPFYIDAPDHRIGC